MQSREIEEELKNKIKRAPLFAPYMNPQAFLMIAYLMKYGVPNFEIPKISSMKDESI